ncbi:MAG: carboxypeptidase-like regulatory domain-containing protein [Bacteroidota bacterium]
MLIVRSLLLIAVTWLFYQESNAQVTGRVSDANQQPLSRVSIIIKKKDRGTQTDARGKYSIIANPGDILLFSHIGMQPVEVRVKRSSSMINVEMQAVAIELDEVAIETWRRHKTQKELLEEYPTNKRLLKTSWGIMDKDLSSTAMRFIDGEDMVPVGPDFLTSLQSHYPQMVIVRNDPEDPGVHVYLHAKRSYSSDQTAIFDLDGIILESTPTHLSANDIDRIAILVRNAAMIRYGPQGAGGVIVINTRAQTWMDDMGVKRTYDNRALVDSLVKEVNRLEPYPPYEPSYIGKWQKAKTEEQALAIYAGQKEKKKYLNDPYYFLEAYELFSSRWGNNEKSNELFQHIIDGYSSDVPVLKALAYQQQKYGNHESALSLYLDILRLQAENAQAHRDMANAYAEAGDFKEALIRYTRYINDICQLSNTPYDAFGDDQLITTEMMSIFEQNQEYFLVNYDIVTATDKDDTHTRLVFEWNNQDTEFELQFVNPDGYYDTWGNKAVNRYSSKQFFIDKEDKGLWQVNIDYKGNRSETPTYLKVSVYHDYGFPGQHIEVKVYKLSKNHKKVQLFTFQ